jgi:hypothetical protein
MNTRKVRQDARLKTLPEERQAQIIAHLQDHRLADTAAWLREDGFVTSATALSEFLSWYRLKQQFSEDASTVESLVEQLKQEVPGLTEPQLDELGQRTFSLLAIRNQDLGGFVKVRSARFKAEIERSKIQLREAAEKRLREGLQLQQEKFRRETVELFVKWSSDLRSREILDKPVSNKAKIEELGRYHFGELWDAGTSSPSPRPPGEGVRTEAMG